jgi:hypothetical protein
VGRSRVTAVALPGEPHSTQFEPHRTSRLLVMGVPLPAGDAAPRSVVATVRDALSARDGVVQQRAFASADATLWLITAFDAPITAGSLAKAIGRPCGFGATTFNLYVPYRRGSP